MLIAHTVACLLCALFFTPLYPIHRTATELVFFDRWTAFDEVVILTWQHHRVCVRAGGLVKSAAATMLVIEHSASPPCRSTIGDCT